MSMVVLRFPTINFERAGSFADLCRKMSKNSPPNLVLVGPTGLALEEMKQISPTEYVSQLQYYLQKRPPADDVTVTTSGCITRENLGSEGSFEAAYVMIQEFSADRVSIDALDQAFKSKLAYILIETPNGERAKVILISALATPARRPQEFASSEDVFRSLLEAVKSPIDPNAMSFIHPTTFVSLPFIGTGEQSERFLVRNFTGVAIQKEGLRIELVASARRRAMVH